VHVVRPAARGREERRGQHAAVVEREEEIGREAGDALHKSGLVRVARRRHLDAARAREAGYAREEHVLAGVVLVGDDEAHVDAGIEQDAKAAGAHVVVGEHHRGCRHQSRFSRVAWMR
jgi:hypothetical protein